MLTHKRIQFEIKYNFTFCRCATGLAATVHSSCERESDTILHTNRGLKRQILLIVPVAQVRYKLNDWGH